ncbi:O-antigen ligase family protein [Kocuria sp. CPCC 205268]|uniref:O-antigen ligase family protein n=1 Tax=Kocuria oxytropis TaxID=3058913 RepID=UPI0034D3973F
MRGLAYITFLLGLTLAPILTLRIGGGINVGDALLALSAFLLVLTFPARRCNPPGHRLRFYATILVAFGGLFASSVSEAPVDSLFVLIRVIYVMTILPWQAIILLNTQRRLSNAILAFAIGAGITGYGTLVQYTLGADAIPGAIVTSAGRYSGFTGHVSDAGGITALAVVLSIGSIEKWNVSIRTLLNYFALFGGVIGLVLSGSVAGMLSAMMGIAAVLLLRGFKLVHLVFPSVLLIGGLYVSTILQEGTKIALSPVERLLQATGISASDRSLNTAASRQETYKLGFQGFLENPLTGEGLDPGSASVIGELGVHNFLLAAAYQGGSLFVVGIGLAALGGGLVAWAHRSKQHASNAAISGALVSITFAMSAPSFYNRYFWIPLTFLIVHAALTSDTDGRNRYWPRTPKTSETRPIDTLINNHSSSQKLNSQ